VISLPVGPGRIVVLQMPPDLTFDESRRALRVIGGVLRNVAEVPAVAGLEAQAAAPEKPSGA
jgi:hypothetical protein